MCRRSLWAGENMPDYESAWTDLKAWLDTKDDYIVIPVRMVKARMNENEDLYNI